MNWQAICDNPLFRGMPFKLETDRWGKIEMSPASNKHGLFQILIAKWLLEFAPNGHPIAECSIQTADGVKAADVTWASNKFLRRHGVTNPYPEAPEIVLETLSSSNTLAEMEEKKELYFARGAREFWLCEESGTMRFYNNHAQLKASVLASGFPV